MDLHIFSDASLKAMYIVTYLLAEADSGVEVCFVTGKCRIAPLKQTTLSKFKLQAALDAVRLRQLIVEGHDICINKVNHWTDSLAVLQWLRSAYKKQQVSVAKRISEILDASRVDEWRRVGER